MRTFIRVLAFLTAFAVGLLFVLAALAVSEYPMHLSVAAGLVLMVSATLLIAVRPPQQAPPPPPGPGRASRMFATIGGVLLLALGLYAVGWLLLPGGVALLLAILGRSSLNWDALRGPEWWTGTAGECVVIALMATPCFLGGSYLLRKGCAMRTFVRGIAFLAACSTGLLLGVVSFAFPYIAALVNAHYQGSLDTGRHPLPDALAVGDLCLNLVLALLVLTSATLLIAVRPRMRKPVAKPARSSVGPSGLPDALAHLAVGPSALPDALAHLADAAARPAAQGQPSPNRTAGARTPAMDPQSPQPKCTCTLSGVYFEIAQGGDGASQWRKVTGWHWKTITPAWSEQQVRDFLGPADRVLAKGVGTPAQVSVWCYGRWPAKYRGTVTFKDGKVIGYDPPDAAASAWVCHTATSPT